MMKVEKIIKHLESTPQLGIILAGAERGERNLQKLAKYLNDLGDSRSPELTILLGDIQAKILIYQKRKRISNYRG